MDKLEAFLIIQTDDGSVEAYIIHTKYFILYRGAQSMYLMVYRSPENNILKISKSEL